MSLCRGFRGTNVTPETFCAFRALSGVFWSTVLWGCGGGSFLVFASTVTVSCHARSGRPAWVGV
eukprot:9832678-Lingulodinium_polyedra.AAC.1